MCLDHTPLSYSLKQCSQCGETKPLKAEYFPPRKEGKDGFRGTCRKCFNERCNASELLKARSAGILPRTRKGKILVCAECGKDFYRQPRRIQIVDNYCSIQCCNSARGRLQTGENNPKYNSSEIPCGQCGTMLKRPRHSFRTREHHFCTEACRGQWQAVNLSGPNSPTYTKIATKCKQCDADMRIAPSTTGKYGNFCNRRCYRIWRRGGILPQAERATDYRSRVADNHRRRAMKLNAPGELTEADIERQHIAQRGKCYYCKCSVGENYHVDHVIPLSRGGSNSPENIVIACVPCNLAKNTKLPHEWPQGGRLL